MMVNSIEQFIERMRFILCIVVIVALANGICAPVSGASSHSPWVSGYYTGYDESNSLQPIYIGMD